MRIRTVGTWLVAAALAIVGCKKTETGSTSAGGKVALSGAGSTFAGPLFTKWTSDYQKAKPDITVNYQAIGSGGGIKSITDKTVDFGATDGPMTDDQIAKAAGILHIPVTMGAVVPIYNLPGLSKALIFDGATLAGIYMGKITVWNDAKIAALNPGVTLPDRPITVVHRSDGSGTTYIWADYLSKNSDEWKSGPGKGTTVKWPVGRGGKGNDGVAGEVKQNEGSIGYVELIFAANNNIAFGDVKNPAGKIVHASEASVTAAAATLKDIPDDLRVSITNAPGDDSYPISSFTWALVYSQQADANKGKAVVDFLTWCIHDGQAMSGPMHYAPLPKPIVDRCDAKLKSIK
jgi:phosphate transport system substrate-binding protein